MVTVEQRNAYYKGVLAARKHKTLSDRPESLNMQCIAMWVAGFNTELDKLKEQEATQAMIANML